MKLLERLKKIQEFGNDSNAEMEKTVSTRAEQIDDVVREVEKDKISEKRKVLENTLISAQKTAEEIIEELIKNAKTEAKEKIEDIVLESQDRIIEMLKDIEEVGKKIQDNLNQKLNNVSSKLSVVLKIEESEEKPSTSREYFGEEVGEIKPEVKETNPFI